MIHRKSLIVVVVIGLIASGIVGVSGPATAQAQSGNVSENVTENSTDDTAFDDPSSVGDNSSTDDSSTVRDDTSINDSSSFVNTNVSYKAPENVTEGNASGNSSYAAGVPSATNNSSSGSYSCSGGLLDALMSGNLDMTCRLKKWVIGMLFGGFMDFMQGIWNAIINGIFTTPAPAVDGDPAIIAEPTNSPWNTLWSIAMYRMVPIGLIIWAFIFLCTLGITATLPLGPFGEYKKRQMNNKAVLAFFGIIGSWAIGSSFLWLTKGVTRAIMPAGEQIASDGALLMANSQAAAIMIIAAYLTGGTMIAYFALLIMFRFLLAGIFMIALPVLIPLVMVDIGPLKYISSLIERFVDTSIMFIIVTIPMGLVLQGGYAIVNALNQGSDAQSAATSAFLTASAGNGVLVFAIWILAGSVPLIMYRQLGQVQGIASSAMNAGRRASNRLQELSESDSSETNGPDYGPGSMRPDDITDGSEIQRSPSTGEFGGALGNGQADTELGQSEPAGMLGRGSGTLGDPRDPQASSIPNRLDEGHPAASALPSGDEGQQPSSGGRWSQFTDHVGNVGGWAGNARSNLNDRINNAREMGSAVRGNGGNFVAGAAGATAGFFGAGTSEGNPGNTNQNTTRSDVGSQTTSTSDTTTSESANRNMRSNIEEKQNNNGSGYYREEKGEQIYVPQSTSGLPSRMDIGPVLSDGFKQSDEKMDTDTILGEFSRMEEKYAESGDVLVTRDPESGQLYDLSEVDAGQQPPERDFDAEERAKGSARDVKNARGGSDD
jgi:hypothetical protein